MLYYNIYVAQWWGFTLQNNSFLEHFLKCEFKIEPMTSGMSFRTYDRVYTPSKSYVMMNVPTDRPLEDGQSAIEGVIRPFLKVHAYLKSLNIGVPEVFNVCEINGKVLLQDLGVDTFYDLFSARDVDLNLYKDSVNDLAKLYTAEPLEDIPVVDEKLMNLRGQYFLDDYLPAITGQKTTTAQYAELESILSEIYKVVSNVKWGTVLWDFHSPNLMPSSQRPVVLDFQDAKYGPLSYDLASLLYDARFPFPRDVREILFNHFVEQVDIQDVQAFKDSFEMAGLLRNIGILGRFARSFYRDGKVEFIPKISVIWPYVDEALENPHAAKLKDFIYKYMPENRLLSA